MATGATTATVVAPTAGGAGKVPKYKRSVVFEGWCQQALGLDPSVVVATSIDVLCEHLAQQGKPLPPHLWDALDDDFVLRFEEPLTWLQDMFDPDADNDTDGEGEDEEDDGSVEELNSDSSFRQPYTKYAQQHQQQPQQQPQQHQQHQQQQQYPQQPYPSGVRQGGAIGRSNSLDYAQPHQNPQHYAPQPQPQPQQQPMSAAWTGGASSDLGSLSVPTHQPQPSHLQQSSVNSSGAQQQQQQQQQQQMQYSSNPSYTSGRSNSGRRRSSRPYY